MAAILLTVSMLGAEEWKETLGAILDQQEVAGRPQHQKEQRVADLVVIGNTITKQGVILKEVSLFPGQLLYRWRLKLAEGRLHRLNRFKGRPKIRCLDNGGTSEFFDIIIRVVEKD